MVDVPVPGHQKFWTDKRTTLKAEYQLLVAKYPNADAQLKQLFKILCYSKSWQVTHQLISFGVVMC
jgi:hypothetical protein